MILSPSLQQRADLKQNLMATLRDLLIQLDTSNDESIDRLKIQTDDRSISQISKMTNYAFENLTNLLNSLDLELT